MQLGLLIQTAPYSRRVGRETLDLALAPAVVDYPVSVFFVDDGIWHCVTGQQPQAAELAAFIRGWGAVQAMGKVELLVAETALQQRQVPNAALAEVFSVLGPAQLSARARQCNHWITAP